MLFNVTIGPIWGGRVSTHLNPWGLKIRTNEKFFKFFLQIWDFELKITRVSMMGIKFVYRIHLWDYLYSVLVSLKSTKYGKLEFAIFRSSDSDQKTVETS